MKKWLFSKNGKILGPFEEQEANNFVSANPEAYAWHPTYSHWMPVTCIGEFEDILPAPKPPTVIPKELIEEFIGEERKVVSRLTQLDEHLALTDTSLLALNDEIISFREVAKNCTDEVKATLQTIEQQFANLSKNLSSFKSTVLSGKQELSEISDDFNQRLEKDNQATLESPVKVNAAKSSSPVANTGGNNTRTTKNDANTVKAVAQSAPVASQSSMQSSAAQPIMNTNGNAAVAPVDETQEVTLPKVKKETAIKIKKSPKREKAETQVTTKKASVTKIEFSDQPSEEDLKLASQIKPLEKPVTMESPDTPKPPQKIVGEFDHILYESLEAKETAEDDAGKKRLRRRRRR